MGIGIDDWIRLHASPPTFVKTDRDISLKTSLPQTLNQAFFLQLKRDGKQK
jgi:hypothetical protein